MARGVPRTPSAIRHSARRHGENVPGLFAAPVPPHLLLHTLSGASGQSRWAHLEVIPRLSGSSVFIQFCSKCRMRPSRGESFTDRTTRCSWHLLWMLQNNLRMEIWTRLWIQSKIQRGQIHNRTSPHDQGEWMGLTVRIMPVQVVALNIQTATYRLTLNTNFCFLDWT